MTKAELVDVVAKQADLTKKDSEVAIDAAMEAIKKAIKKDKEFRYPGLGTFKVRTRKARKGINPQTGKSIQIKASKTVNFKPAAEFKSKL